MRLLKAMIMHKEQFCLTFLVSLSTFEREFWGMTHPRCFDMFHAR